MPTCKTISDTFNGKQCRNMYLETLKCWPENASISYQALSKQLTSHLQSECGVTNLWISRQIWSDLWNQFRVCIRGSGGFFDEKNLKIKILCECTITLKWDGAILLREYSSSPENYMQIAVTHFRTQQDKI
jgi:hypothetical protein